MSISLKKGQKISLTKATSQLKKIIVGLGWNISDNANFDLDASAFLLGDNGKVTCDNDFIFYNNLKHHSGAIEHLGDNLIGTDSGDAEEIIVDLSKIPASIKKITFTVTLFESEERGQNFRQVTNAFIRIVDAVTSTELVRYELNENYPIDSAIIAGEIYRHNDEWKFNAIGSGYSGGLAALGRNYGVKTENKTARISVALYPAVKLDIKKLAALRQCSLSDIVNDALKQFIESHRQEIKQYDDFIKNGKKN